MNSPSDYLSRTELGLAVAQFKRMEETDPYWRDIDHERAVRFWCSDLTAVRTYLPWARRDVWTIVNPRGKRVVTASSQTAAWRFALAVIKYHLKKERG